MNDYGGSNNFTALLNQLFTLWLLSEYALLTPYKIPYVSEKNLGFYFTNYDFFLSDDSKSIEIKAVGFTIDKLEQELTNREQSVHVFAPVSLTSGQEIEVAEQDAVGDFMPAFYLKGVDDKNAVANLETGIFLAVDIISTFSGFGNLLKFTRLLKLLNMSEGIFTLSKGLVIFKTVIAGIELSSGIIGTMMTLSNNCSSKFCNALRNCLFYLELLSLGADVVVSRLLRNSAVKALDNARYIPNKEVPEELYQEMIGFLSGLAKVKVLNAVDSELKQIDEAIEKLGIEIKVPKNKLGQAQSAQKIEAILKEIKKTNKNFNPGKNALKKEGIKLPKTQNGLGVCVDFKGTQYLYPVTGNQKNIVRIKLTGSRRFDNKLAYELSGIKRNKNYTWHHLDDFNPVTNTCTMQLVLKDIHKITTPHAGAVAIVEKYFSSFRYSK